MVPARTRWTRPVLEVKIGEAMTLLAAVGLGPKIIFGISDF